LQNLWIGIFLAGILMRASTNCVDDGTPIEYIIQIFGVTGVASLLLFPPPHMLTSKFRSKALSESTSVFMNSKPLFVILF
jgi:hypothetical protein